MILASNPSLYLSTVNSFILPNCKLECVSLPDPMPYTATSGNTFSPYDFDLLPLYFVCSLSLCVVYMCGVYTLIRVWHIFMCVDGGQKLNFYLHWFSGILRHGFSLDPRDVPEASPQRWFLDSVCSQTLTAQWLLYNCGPVRLSLLENSTGSLTVAMWPPVNLVLAVSCIERLRCDPHHLRWRKGRFVMFVQQWSARQHCSQSVSLSLISSDPKWDCKSLSFCQSSFV